MTSSDSENLKNVFRELNVGSSGYLSQNELSIVCQHIGMPKMSNQELSQLFSELDHDSDGKVSLDEFVNGILQDNNSHKYPNLADPLDGNNYPYQDPDNPFNRELTIIPKDRSGKRLERSKSKMRTSLSSKLNWLKSLAADDSSGLVNAQVLIDFWNKCSIQEGRSILELLDLDAKSKIDLKDLSNNLEHQLRLVVNEEDNVLPVITVDSMCAIIASLQSENEDLIGEKEQLRLESEASKKLAADVADDADVFIAKLEKSKNEEIKALTEQLSRRTSQGYNVARSPDVQQMADQLYILKRENNELREKIVNLELLKAEKENINSNNWDKTEPNETKRLQAAFSIERRELREACLMEISEVEQKCQERISRLEKDMQDLISSQQRRMDEALAEKERDLLCEFVKESMKKANDLKENKSDHNLRTFKETETMLIDDISSNLRSKETELERAKSELSDAKNRILLLEKDLETSEIYYKDQIQRLSSKSTETELEKAKSELSDAKNKILLLEKDLETSELNYKNQIQQLRHNFEEMKKGLPSIIKDAELNDSKDRLQENINALDKEVSRLKSDNEKLIDDNRKNEESSKNFESKWRLAIAEKDKLQDTIKELNNHAGRDVLKNELEKCMQELLDATTSLSLLNKKYEHTKVTMSLQQNDLTNANKNLLDANEILKREVDQLLVRNKELMAMVEERGNVGNHADGILGDLKDAENRLGAVNDRFQKEMEEAQQRELILKNEIAALTHSLNQTNSDKFGLDLQIQRLKVESDLKSVQISQFEKEKISALDREGEVKNLADDLKTQLATLKKDRSQLLISERQLKCEVEALKNLLDKQAEENKEIRNSELKMKQQIFRFSAREREIARKKKKVPTATLR